MTRKEAKEFLEKVADDLGCIGMEEEYTRGDGVKMLEAVETLENEPCEDCISRAKLLKAIDTWDKFGLDDTNHLFRLDNLSLPYYAPYIHYDDAIKCIKGMPSVQPKPKTGHWKVVSDGYGDSSYICECSECADTVWVYKDADRKWNYCPNCGAKMEDK